MRKRHKGGKLSFWTNSRRLCLTASVLVVLCLETRSIFGSIEICAGGSVPFYFFVNSTWQSCWKKHAMEPTCTKLVKTNPFRLHCVYTSCTSIHRPGVWLSTDLHCSGPTCWRVLSFCLWKFGASQTMPQPPSTLQPQWQHGSVLRSLQKLVNMAHNPNFSGFIGWRSNPPSVSWCCLERKLMHNCSKPSLHSKPYITSPRHHRH